MFARLPGAIVDALHRYRALHGTYPDSLAQLDAVGPAPASRGAATYPIRYWPDGNGFGLRFEYTGLGNNHCTYRSGELAWSCGGYL